MYNYSTNPSWFRNVMIDLIKIIQVLIKKNLLQDVKPKNAANAAVSANQ